MSRPIQFRSCDGKAAATGLRPAGDLAELPWSLDDEASSGAVFTSLVWIVCLVVGIIGLVLHYERPSRAKPSVPPIVAQRLEVELAPEPLPPTLLEPEPPDSTVPLPPPAVLTPTPLIQPIALAQPVPASAFPSVTEVVAPARAAEGPGFVALPAGDTTASPPDAPVQSLVFGQGAGKQPAPEYPSAAQRQGQEGTVVVRFLVGENGRVHAAQAVLPSAWPLLNEAALRAVRERWRFQTGSARRYEVAIRFEIVK